MSGSQNKITVPTITLLPSTYPSAHGVSNTVSDPQPNILHRW